MEKQLEKIKIQYNGIYPVIFVSPGIKKIINPGETIEVFKSVFDSEFKNHSDYSIAKLDTDSNILKNEEKK